MYFHDGLEFWNLEQHLAEDKYTDNNLEMSFSNCVQVQFRPIVWL